MTLRGIWVVSVSLSLLTLGCSSDDETNDSSMGGSDMGSSGMGGSMPGNAGSMATGGSGGAASGSGGSAGTGSPGPVSFQNDVWPVLRENCAGAGCHGDGSFLPLHASSDVNVAYEEAQEFADKIAGRVSGQQTPIMPQGCGPAPGFGMCLSLDEVALIRAWVEQGTPF